VEKLVNTGYLEDQTLFANNKFVYALQSVDEGSELSAAMDNNKITMFVPKRLTEGWVENTVIGFNANLPLEENTSLYLLLEKDFICLDETTEDQSDNYENPNKTC